MLADRALDIYDLRYRGENISFLSKNGLCAFGGAFENVFPGGFLYTCGLEKVGGGDLPVLFCKSKSMPLNTDSTTIKAQVPTATPTTLMAEMILMAFCFFLEKR